LGVVAVSAPAAASAATVVSAVAAGDFDSCAVTSTGGAYCWGDNSDGELGDGTTNSSSTPVAVQLPSGVRVTAIAANGEHACAVTSAGAAYCWGFNNAGQLGDGTTNSSSTPVAVQLPSGVSVTAIATGECGLLRPGV
jgi:alpha-tubulin suppressor-like RCC1 family protein